MNVKLGKIQGVELKTLKRLTDDRGFLMEILRSDDPLFSHFGQAYVTGVRSGVAKAWHYHREQSDHFVCVGGKALVALCDTREESPTRGAAMEVVLHSPLDGDENLQLLRIPPLVLHGFTAVDCDHALILNIPNRLYDREAPDEFRVPWNSPDAPYCWPPFVTRGG